MTARFNPPPGWPSAPSGWTPPPGWRPDPSWPAAPAFWSWWVDAPFGTADRPDIVGVAGAGQDIGGVAGPGPDFVAADASWLVGPPGTVGPSPRPAVSAAGHPPVPTLRPARLTGVLVGIVGIVVITLTAVGIAGFTRASASGPTASRAVPASPTTRPSAGSQPSTSPSAGGTSQSGSPTGGPSQVTAPGTSRPSAATPSGPSTSPSTTRTAPSTPRAVAPSSRPPTGYTPARAGDQVTLSDIDGQRVTVVLQRVQRDTSCTTPSAEGTLYRVDLRLSLEAGASTPFTFSSLTMMGVTSDTHGLPLGLGGALCMPPTPMSDAIEPGQSASGSVIIDAPAGATWLTFAPDYGFTGDAVAWPLR